MNGLNAFERQYRTTGALAMIAQSVADILNHHVKLAVEGIDRMYLNIYVPKLQHEQGIVWFFREHRGLPVPSAAVMSPMSRNFVAKLEGCAAQHEVPLIQFRKGQRKDDVMAEHLRKFQREEGVVFIGKAQEKTPVFRTEKRKSPKTGRPYPWIVRSTAMVNHYYVYAVDRDFGPFLPQVLQLLSFQCQAVPERPRIRQMPTRPARRCVRGARQWRPELRRPRTSAEDLRRPLGAKDRCPAAQVAALAAPSVHRGRSPRRLPL